MFQTEINIKDRMKYHNVTGLSVTIINDGQMSRIENYGVLEAGINKKVDNDTIFSACSISKLLTALIVLKLTEQEILDLDEDINKKLISWKIPHNNFADNQSLTLRNLLSHQSGVIDPEDSFMELNPNIDLPSMVEILEGSTPYCKAPIEITYEPERDFQYADAGFCIIQQLIEDVTGKTFKEVAKELIFHPLKMTNSMFFQNIPKGTKGTISAGHNKNGEIVDGKYPVYPYPAASGLWTTTSDLSKLILELMDALQNKTKIGVSEKKVSEMITSQGCKSWTGLGVFLGGSEKELEISSLGWGVGFQCMLVAYPHLGNGLIIMTNTNLGVHQMEGIIGEIYHSFKTQDLI